MTNIMSFECLCLWQRSLETRQKHVYCSLSLWFILQINVILWRGWSSGCRCFSVNTKYLCTVPNMEGAMNWPKDNNFTWTNVMSQKRGAYWEDFSGQKRQINIYFQVPKKRGALRGFKARLRLPSSYRSTKVANGQ